MVSGYLPILLSDSNQLYSVERAGTKYTGQQFMVSALARIGSVGINVSGIPKSLEFYEGILVSGQLAGP